MIYLYRASDDSYIATNNETFAQDRIAEGYRRCTFLEYVGIRKPQFAHVTGAEKSRRRAVSQLILDVFMIVIIALVAFWLMVVIAPWW